VADTYNNKIKVIDIARRTCQSVAGSGRPGATDAAAGGIASFNEPGGISAAGGRLFIADTNNHAIRILQLSPPHAVSTLQLGGLLAPKSGK
jgi:hypothetical protein